MSKDLHTRNGTRIRDLQMCATDPRDLEGAKAALGSIESLTGMNQSVVVRSYGRSRRPTIRTLLVRTDPDGHLAIAATGGTYRYLVVGGGTANLHITSLSGTLVEVVEDCTVVITTTDVSFNLHARKGHVTITTVPAARGTITIAPGANCTVTGNGPGLRITHGSGTDIGTVSAALSAELIARIPADPWGIFTPRQEKK